MSEYFPLTRSKLGLVNTVPAGVSPVILYLGLRLRVIVTMAPRSISAPPESLTYERSRPGFSRDSVSMPRGPGYISFGRM